MSVVSALCLPRHSPRTLKWLTLLFLSADKNLEELSSLGHFLKGSSATLGFNKVKDQCEKIQHYGHKKDETGTVDEPDEAKLLRLIGESVRVAKRAYLQVSDLMKRYYEQLEAWSKRRPYDKGWLNTNHYTIADTRVMKYWEWRFHCSALTETLFSTVCRLPRLRTMTIPARPFTWPHSFSHA